MSTKSILQVTLILVACFSFKPTAMAQNWADLKMTVLYDGDVPEPRFINNPGFGPIPNERLVVDPMSHGIANMVLLLDDRASPLAPDHIHPNLSSIPDENAVLNCKECRFVPHNLAMRSGQILSIIGNDRPYYPILNFFNNAPLPIRANPRGGNDYLISNKEILPAKIEDGLYPWMGAYVIAAAHPYVGISNDAGMIKIEKLPAGIELSFKMWHESQNKSIEQVTVDGEKQTWSKGGFKLKLQEGENNFGTVLLKANRFRD